MSQRYAGSWIPILDGMGSFGSIDQQNSGCNVLGYPGSVPLKVCYHVRSIDRSWNMTKEMDPRNVPQLSQWIVIYGYCLALG